MKALKIINIINKVLLEGKLKNFISRFAADLAAVLSYVKRTIFMSVNKTLRRVEHRLL